MCTFLCHLDVMDSLCVAWLSFGQDFLVNIFQELVEKNGKREYWWSKRERVGSRSRGWSVICLLSCCWHIQCMLVVG